MPRAPHRTLSPGIALRSAQGGLHRLPRQAARPHGAPMQCEREIFASRSARAFHEHRCFSGRILRASRVLQTHAPLTQRGVLERAAHRVARRDVAVRVDAKREALRKREAARRFARAARERGEPRSRLRLVANGMTLGQARCPAHAGRASKRKCRHGRFRPLRAAPGSYGTASIFVGVLRPIHRIPSKSVHDRDIAPRLLPPSDLRFSLRKREMPC